MIDVRLDWEDVRNKWAFTDAFLSPNDNNNNKKMFFFYLGNELKEKSSADEDIDKTRHAIGIVRELYVVIFFF